ncbi:Retinitis pigmentosa 1-like 1 protein [Heterocephalus glaber]|uniref:Retinitis pigmentosa 1-like 1 protein n=1 Tax=Heterocephalus glaber TaxID=10181 RepID=G5AMG7_HETGA|nr:Retinitis pigmentosa 1-like 1 protein [Heterocephalus glaber]
MGELSQRMPLSFRVRSITTPRGLHGLSALEQLQDGGCYLCSDKKPSNSPRGPGRPQARSPSAVQSGGMEGGQESPSTSSSRRGPAALRRITLVKNGDSRCHQTLLLSHRDTRSLTAFLSRASDLLQFPVKQVYTVSGRKAGWGWVDPLQALLRSPSVLVCAGKEAFRPLALDSAQKNETEAASALTSRAKSGSWGPKPRPSVIHSRARSGSRAPKSLLSARPGLSQAPASLPGAWPGPSPPGPSGNTDSVKKEVCMNKDGSLSVEMRVRLHLLGKNTMLCSQRVGRAGGEGQGLKEVDPDCCRWKALPRDSLESRAGRAGLCKAGCQPAFDDSRQPRPSFEIWRNPLCIPWGERPALGRRSGWAQGRKRLRKDFGSPASSAEHPEGSDPDSCSLRTPEGSDSPCLASEAASPSRAKREAGGAQYPEGVQPPCWEQQGYQGPRTRGVEGAFSDSSASAKSRGESGKWEGQQWGCLGGVWTGVSRRKAARGDSPCPLSLNIKDLQTEEHGQGTGSHGVEAGPVMTRALGLGQSGSWDMEGISFPLSACTSARLGRRRQQSPGSAASSPGIPDPCQVSQRGQPRLCPHCRDPHCPVDSPEAPAAPRPPNRGNTCPEGPVPPSAKSPSTSRQPSGNLSSTYPGSPDLQDPAAASRAAISPMSGSDWASGSYHPRACSAELAGDTEGRPRFSAPTPAHTQGAGRLGDETGSTPSPSPPSLLPVGWLEGEEPGAQHSWCSSKMGMCPVPGTPDGHTEACWACSGYCPAPPGGQPCPERHPSSSSSSSVSSGHQSADDRGSPGEPGEETLKVGHMPSPSPKPGGPGRGLGGAGGSLSSGPRAGTEEPPEDGSVTPSTLPHTSLDAVVREWLDNILEEPMPLRNEMVDESMPATHGSPGGAGEDAVDSRRQLPEGDPAEHPKPAQALPGTGDADPKLGDGLHQGTGPGEVPETAAKAGVGGGVPVGLKATLRALPSRVSVSTQIMRALMGSKQGRPSSLPEVSGPAAQRLSQSVKDSSPALPGFASLMMLSGFRQTKGVSKTPLSTRSCRALPRACGPGDLGQGPLDLDLVELTACQGLLVTKDFTPTSSSGVDLSSGSGGSGEGSVPCAVDATLVPEQMVQPLQISSQRSNSRSSGCLEHRANPQQRCSMASSGSSGQEEAGNCSREQTLGPCLEQLDNNPEPFIENTTQGWLGQAEETAERERPPAEGV